MSRSKWKGVFIEKVFFNKFLLEYDGPVNLEDSEVKIFNYKDNLRNSTIIDLFVGYQFNVYNGLDIKSVVVNEKMIGFKFGDFFEVNKVNQYEGRVAVARRRLNREINKIQKRRARLQKKLEKDD